MICPLMSKASEANGTLELLMIGCKKENCAWWSEPENCCSIKLIASNSIAEQVYLKRGR